MSTIKTERLEKILSETQAVISECNSHGVHGSVEVNARLFENVLMELLCHRAAMLQGADGNSPVIPDGWVACSERMPTKQDGTVFLTWNGQYIGKELFLTGSFLCLKPEIITHWMPLPAAPQQEGAGGR
ncbi:TPA: DUF551 domain-containing protein [Enterobacter ludwigii]|nr:DUF551 domain-containing protein [Enterobacter ludwigii]HDR2600139.1 DUF551 domain-containing protein [Enterobacter ludwigii]